MLTSENLKFCFEELTAEQVSAALDSKSDYITLELCALNTGAVPFLSSADYNEEEESEVPSNGGLYLDKDDFLRLYSEAIDEYL